jgi:uracil-DNA glycosylase
MADQDTNRQLAEHLRMARDLGVDGTSRDPAWRVRTADAVPGAPAAADAIVHPAQSASAPGTAASREPGGTSLDTLPVIRDDIGDCTRCKLHALGRRQIVFGVGSPTADLMFIGEAPGADEDVQGIPFVGRAGQLLTKIIEAIGLTRDQVYIANIIKCRPPENRNPEPDEVAACEPFVFRQVQTIRPKVIVALGTFAAQALLRTRDPISRLRGNIFTYGDAKLIPTFHPAFLLRSPERKRDVWEDMKKVRELLHADAPESM